MLFSILTGVAEGKIQPEEAVDSIQALTKKSQASDATIRETATDILKTVETNPTLPKDRLIKAFEKCSDQEKVRIYNVVKEYLQLVEERAATLDPSIKGALSSHLRFLESWQVEKITLEQVPEAIQVEWLMHLDIPELFVYAKTNRQAYSLSQDNAIWRSIASKIGWEDIEKGEANRGEVKKKFLERYKLLRQQIKNLPEDIPADVKTALKETPPTIETIKFLKSWQRARDTFVVWEVLATDISQPVQLLRNSGKQMIEQANGLGEFSNKGFSTWMIQNKTDLASLTKLDLQRKQLSTLPPEIWNLAALRFLWLTRNQLTKLPPEIENLVALGVLNLSDNQLTALPDSIAELAALSHLDLSHNKFKSSPSQLKNVNLLKEINLAGNPLDKQAM
jgi:Leucine rich repeat